MGPQSLPLVLGGHSFIEQLGNDPLASPAEQTGIVRECLDQGIIWFDTTYQPERIVLGRALDELGRRDEARILAWNFFTDFGPGRQVGDADYYREWHLQVMLDQLRTDRIDALVVHDLHDENENQRQLELALSWQQRGSVGMLGTWAPGPEAGEVYGERNPFQLMVRPYNVTTRDAGPAFSASRRLGWATFACSPFVRGWELDGIVSKARRRGSGNGQDLLERVADHMLRYSLFAPNVDKLIVSMRRAEWVRLNVESVNRGPLTAKESAWLDALVG